MKNRSALSATLVGAARPENELHDADWIGLLDLIVAFKKPAIAASGETPWIASFRARR